MNTLLLYGTFYEHYICLILITVPYILERTGGIGLAGCWHLLTFDYRVKQLEGS